MKARSFDPLKFDVDAFVRDGAALQGEWPAASLPRLADGAAPEAPPSGWPAVTWSAQGELRTPKGGQAQVWLELQAQATVALTCQRCLKPVEEHLEVSRWFRFVRDESQAAELDMESEDDVLVLARHMDLRELVEDELLLELPVVPRHDECPEPLVAPESAQEEELAEPERPNPFAALAALKKSKPE